MSDQHRNSRPTDPTARRASAGVVLVLCLVSGAAYLLSFDPFDELDRGDRLIVNLYAIILSLLAGTASGLTCAFRLVTKNWLTVPGALLALTFLTGTYRFLSY